MDQPRLGHPDVLPSSLGIHTIIYRPVKGHCWVAFEDPRGTLRLNYGAYLCLLAFKLPAGIWFPCNQKKAIGVLALAEHLRS